MPLYEYRCHQCGQVFEVMQKFSEQPLQVHEGCGGVVERLLSAPAIQFKGSGWYITDYARAGANGGKDGKDKGESKVETKTETKTDNKTDTKSESKSTADSSSPNTTAKS
jgi:putative FmdB family regulatory protein